MSISIFEHNLETNLMKIIGSYLTAHNIDANISRGESAEVQKLPLIIVHATDGEEAVFQSGLYRLKLTATVKVDADQGGADLSAQLFGAVFDIFQMTDLTKQMMDLGGLYICGTILLEYTVEDPGDRMWSKSISMDFFGNAVE